MNHFFLIVSFFLISNVLYLEGPGFYCYSQGQIKFWDTHKEKVVEAKIHPSQKYILTRDAIGKIILWETEEFKYVKTLFKPTSYNVTGIRWVMEGNSIAISQNRTLNSSAYRGDKDRTILKWQDSIATERDSLFIIPVFENGKSLDVKASVDFISPDNKRFDIVAHYHETQNVVYSISSDSSFNGFKIISPFPHHHAADFNAAKNEVLIGASNYRITDPPVLYFMNTENYNTITWIELSFKPQYILFDNNENKYLIIGADLNKEQLSYAFFDPLTLQLSDIKTIEGKTGAINSEIVHNTYRLENGHYRIVISISGIYEYVFDYSNGKLTPIKKTFNDKLYKTAPFFIPEKKAIGFFNHETKMGLEIWDYKNERKISQYDMPSRPLAEATFLENGSWSVSGTSKDRKMFLKHFQKDALLNNRFSSVFFLDYISEKFGITYVVYYHFDRNSGKIVFSGYQKDEKRFFVYDLNSDIILTTIIDPKEEYQNPIGLSDSLNRIMVSDGFEYKLSTDGFYFVRIIDQEKTVKINTPASVSLLSADGKHLLLKDTTNTVRVFNVVDKPKEIYARMFDQEFLRDFKINTNIGFSFSASSYKEGFSLNSYVLTIEDNNVNENKIEGHQVYTLFKEKDYTVALLGFGAIRNLIINLKDSTVFQKNFYGEGFTPYSLSANFKENRLLVNNEEGFTTFIDLNTKEDLGYMTHYNERDQVILSTKGHFSSNIDVSRILYMENSETSYNWVNERNAPEEVLHLFGTVDIDYKDFLANVKGVNTLQNQPLEKGLENNQFKIKSLDFPELGGKLTTDQQSVLTEIEFEGNQKTITAVEIKINKGLNYLLKKSKKEFAIKENLIQFKLDLANGDNNIEVRLITAENNFSNSLSKLLVNVNAEPGNLYLLSIGVSEYQESSYDLVYADKDAMDLAILYGDSSDIDIEKYKMKFYANEYHLSGENINVEQKRISSLNTRSSWESKPLLKPVDSVGIYWAEQQGSALFLWDFEKGLRKKIFVEDKKNSISRSNLVIASDNSGFFFFTEKRNSFFDEAFFYDFKSGKSLKTKLPENLIKCISKNKFLVYEKDYSTWEYPLSFMEVELINGEPKGTKNEVLKLNSTSEFGELKFITMNKAYTHLLFYNEEKEIVLVQKQGEEIYYEKLEGIQFESLSTYLFLNNTIIISSNYEEFFKRYDIKEKRVEKIDISKSEVGINFYNSNTLKIIMKEPLEKNTEPHIFSNKSLFETYSDSRPHSFNKKNILCLTNEDATKNKIISALESFFNDVSANDQVVLFMAGHGVLDTNNEFLFAPHDMNYSNPNEKGISYNEIIKKIKPIPTANKLILFDACHSGNIFSNSEDLSSETFKIEKPNGRGAKRVNQSSSYSSSDIQKASDFLFDKVISSTGITVLSASSGDDVAYEGLENLSNGNFTASIISLLMSNLSSSNIYFSLKEEASGLKITEDILYTINKKIINTSQSRQIPNIREINKHANLFLW
jgi:hypothetical protein